MVPEQPKKRLDAKAIAKEIWRLDDIPRTADPAEVRHALSKVVKQIVLDLEPGEKTKRGQKYNCTGGVMSLDTDSKNVASVIMNSLLLRRRVHS